MAVDSAASLSARSESRSSALALAAVAARIAWSSSALMAAGALGFVVVEGANVLGNPIMLYGLLFAISSMALVGLDREMRMSGGERDD